MDRRLPNNGYYSFNVESRKEFMTYQLPILPYAGTSGHSGSETSRLRAVEADRSGVTQARQQAVLELIQHNNYHGVTWKEVADTLNLHHGSASGSLSVLHKAGRIVRLKETRDKCKIYVLDRYRNDRPAEGYGGKTQSRREIIREIEAFAGDYSHFVNGREVVIVDQLLTYLKIKK